MENSTHLIFSFFQNVQRGLKKGKINGDLYFLVPEVWYKSLKSYTMRPLLRIYSEMENSHYNFRDIFRFMLINEMFGVTTTLFDIRTDSVKECRELFSTSRVNKDLEIVRNMADKGNLSSEDFYAIHEEDSEPNKFGKFVKKGTNLLYSMVMDKIITPVVYVKGYRKYFLTLDYEFIRFSSDEMNRFNFIINLLYKTLPKGAK